MTEQTMQSLDALLDGKPATTEAQPPATPPEGTPPEGAGTTPEGTTEGTPPEGTPPAKTPEEIAAEQAAAEKAAAEKAATDKTNAAFASLRVENTESNKLIQTLGEALGLTGTLAEVKAQLKDLAIKKQATTQNVPAEVLKIQLQQQEQIQQLTRDKNYNALVEGFATLAASTKATDAQLAEFGEYLDNEGLTDKFLNDPSTVDLDYHFYKKFGSAKTQAPDIDALIAAAVAKALGTQPDTSTGADGKPSTPPRRTGGGTGGDGTKIDTVKALDAFLDSTKK